MSAAKKSGTGKKKTGVKKAQKFQSSRADDIVEDLDLDVDEYFEDEALPATFDGKEEERVVLNKRTKKGAKKGGDSDSDDDVHAVLPNDAHRGIHANEDEDAAVEEAALAMAKNKKARKGLSEDDFDLDGVVVPKAAAKAAAAEKAQKNNTIESALETVQRDLSHLSSADRRALLEKESPEVIKLLEEYKTYLAEVTKLSKPLHEMIHNKKVTSAEERNLLAFLETKAQLLLSYCMHVSFYLLLKAEGKPIANHPVIDRLVELRVYIEKLWPLEQKLQYSLNKLIAQGPSASAAAGAGVKLTDLRPVSVEEGALYKPAGAKLADDEAKQRRLARRQQQEDEELRQAEEEAMVRVQRKKGKTVDTAFLEHAAEDGYREDEDQFFSRMVADGSDDEDDDDEEAHLSLIEKLRAKADKKKASVASSSTATAAGKKRGRDEDEDDEEGEDGFDDDDMLSDMDEEGEDEDDAYEQLVAENRAIKRQKDDEKAEREAANEKYQKSTKDLDRRKISKHITTHRGLTKVRPKDRKTPHLAQRHKYDKGLAKARGMSKSFKPEEAGGFSGVAGFRANVTHGTKL